MSHSAQKSDGDEPGECKMLIHKGRDKSEKRLQNKEECVSALLIVVEKNGSQYSKLERGSMS